MGIENKNSVKRGSKMTALAGILFALALTGCREGNADDSAVIAKIGKETITEAQFHELINTLIGDEEKAKEFLTDERNRSQRNEFLAKYVESRGLIMLAKEEGLDKDAKVRIQLDEAITNVYYQALLERRLSGVEPTDEQLRALYDEVSASQKAVGGQVPSFDESKPYLPQYWKQTRQKESAESLMKEVDKKYPSVIADDYKTD